jgi:hypothetical protein
MSTKGKTQNEIYNVCNNIIKNEMTFRIKVYIVENSFNGIAEVKITNRRDRLSNCDTKQICIANILIKSLAQNFLNDMIQADNSIKRFKNSNHSLLVDHISGKIFVNFYVQS